MKPTKHAFDLKCLTAKSIVWAVRNFWGMFWLLVLGVGIPALNGWLNTGQVWHSTDWDGYYIDNGPSYNWIAAGRVYIYYLIGLLILTALATVAYGIEKVWKWAKKTANRCDERERYSRELAIAGLKAACREATIFFHNLIDRR